jgi:FtsH-binding integral membrane protein
MAKLPADASHPVVLLTLQTACEAYTLGVTVTHFDQLIVLQAFVITARMLGFNPVFWGWVLLGGAVWLIPRLLGLKPM